MAWNNLRQIAKDVLGKVGLLGQVQAFRDAQRLHDHKRRLRILYRQFIEPGDLCFDVGANYGDRSRIFLDLNARVVAIEPQPKCVAALQARYASTDRFIVVAGGVSDRSGEHELYLCTNHGTTSMSQEWISHVKNRKKLAQHSWPQTIIVQVYTLDDLIAQYGKPVFCKIDVEGFESQVLKGLSQPIRVLSFECTPELKNPTYDCIDHLRSLGNYVFNYSHGESAQLYFPTWVDRARIFAFIDELDPARKSGDVYAMLA